ASAFQTGSHSILERIASLQPELAPKLLEFIENQGPRVIDECMQSDAALRRHVEAGLIDLFAAEERAADPGPSQLFQKGPGHSLPGAGASTTPVIRSINASVRPKAFQTKPSTRGQGAPAEVPPSLPTPTMAGYHRVVQDSPAPPAKPRVVAAETRSSPAAPARSGHSRRIWGLEELLSELGLLEYEEAAAAWASQMGAAFLEELVENSEELAQAICLKPLEQKRLQRMGPEVAERLRRARPVEAESRPPPRPPPAATVTDTPEAEAPVPDALPATALWTRKWSTPANAAASTWGAASEKDEELV
ncbi:unnamed protein product, partial [Symbiodinium natans]